MRFLKSSALSASLIVAAVSSASLPARAQGLFDGSWSVRVVAGPGKCANQYFVAIEVADGRISYGGRTGRQCRRQRPADAQHQRSARDRRAQADLGFRAMAVARVPGNLDRSKGLTKLDPPGRSQRGRRRSMPSRVDKKIPHGPCFALVAKARAAEVANARLRGPPACRASRQDGNGPARIGSASCFRPKLLRRPAAASLPAPPGSL